MMLFVCFAVMALVVLLDQITKLLIVNFMTLGESIPVIKGVLNLTYITNKGAAMGMLSDNRWVFMIFSTLAIIGLTVFLVFSHKTLGKFTSIAFSMIIGGGIGNMIDRMFNGEVFCDGAVVDFIDFCAFPDLWKWTFNVADAFVTVGVGLVVFLIVFDEIRRKDHKNTEDRTEETEK